MSEERLMILRMLSEGKVTPEEAHALLDALGEDTPAPGRPPAGPPPDAAGWGPEIAESVQRSLDKSLEQLRKQRPLITKVGVHIDRDQATDTVERRLPMAAGDVLRLQNKLGDINVEFVDGPELVLTARRTAWGSDPDDARRRWAGTSLELVRTGRVVTVAAEGPRMQPGSFGGVRATARHPLPPLPVWAISRSVPDRRPWPWKRNAS